MGFQQSKNIFKQWNKFKDHLLLEITEEERAQIDDAIVKASQTPQALPFDDQFDGKLREVVPIKYNAFQQDNTLGRMLNQLVAAGWKIDLNTGLASKDFETEYEGETRVKTRQMKINAVWTTILSLLQKRYELTSTAEKKAKEEAKLQGKSWVLLKNELLKNEPEFKKVDNQLVSLLGSVSDDYLSGATAFSVITNKINGYIETWKSEAPKLKGKLGDSTYSVVFSRNPIDVLRMSDYGNILSCHSPPSSGREGTSYYKCAVAEAIDGGAIALLVNTKDLEGIDINELEIFADPKRGIEGIDPISRVRLRYIKDDQTGAQLAVPESRIYGSEIKGFKEAVNTWASTMQAGEINKILSSLDDNVLDLKRFTMFGGSYEDTNIGYLFQSLALHVPNLKKLKFENEPKYSGETEERVVYGDVAALRREVESVQVEFNENMKNTGLYFDSYDVYRENGETSIVPRVMFQIDLDPIRLAVTDEDEISVMFMTSNIGKNIISMFSEFGVPYTKYFGNFKPHFSSGDPPRVIFYIDRYEIYKEEPIQDIETLENFLTHVYNSISKVKEQFKELVNIALTDYGVYKGAELTALSNDINNNEFRLSDWTLNVVEDGIIPDEIECSITIEIAVNLINNIELFLRGISSSKFIFNIKKQTTGNIRESNIFFDKDDDIVMTYIILTLDKQSDDDVIKNVREMIESPDIKEEFKTKIVQVINDMFKPLETTTKLNELKHITNNWKNFLL